MHLAFIHTGTSGFVGKAIGMARVAAVRRMATCDFQEHSTRTLVKHPPPRRTCLADGCAKAGGIRVRFHDGLIFIVCR
jgi:hypothetical protein